MEKLEIPEVSEQERNAIRAFLARTEVRQSTLHRIATAFVSGAGLLLLIPIFLRDVVDSLLAVYLNLPGNLPFSNFLINGVLFFLLLYPFVLSLGIPLYGVYLLLKDIVHFYFTIYSPGFAESLLNPTFSMSGLALSPDEAPAAKRAVIQLQYQHPQIEFLMPFSEGRRELYFDKLVESTKGDILPSSRRREALADILPEDTNWKDDQRMSAAFGLARSLDRSLIEEVAVAEMALARNILYLRRLVLRYAKTLLMFLWTAVISFVALPFVNHAAYPKLWVLAIVYMIWSIIALRMLHWPIRWIYRHRYDSLPHDQIDAQLTHMERRIIPYVWTAIVASMLAIGILITTNL
jgi:hypothetical protein